MNRDDIEEAAKTLRRKIGMTFGALSDMDGLMRRVQVDEDTGCWLWLPVMAKGRATVPTAQSPAGGFFSVPRWVYIQKRGRIPDSHIVWRTCMERRCCCPNHLKAGTRGQFGEWVAQQEAWVNDPKRRAASKAGAASRRVLTPEVIREIDARGESRAEAAARLGVHERSISRARARTEHTHGASVFSWRP